MLYRYRTPLRPPSYWSATRHPWPCLVFLLPLLLVYEAGVLWLGGTQPDAVRNGADTWLRWGLEAFGVHHFYAVPGLLVVGLVLWAWSARDRQPNDVVTICIGMALESAAFAAGLWGINRSLGPLLDRLGVVLSAAPTHAELIASTITFVGAGIYEEVLFRLLLYAGVFWLARHCGLGTVMAFVVAACSSSLLFAAAHHWGPYGQPFDGYAFLFRSLAGLYFSLLFQARGFGIAVGAHVGYDLLVGVALL